MWSERTFQPLEGQMVQVTREEGGGNTLDFTLGKLDVSTKTFLVEMEHERTNLCCVECDSKIS